MQWNLVQESDCPTEEVFVCFIRRLRPHQGRLRCTAYSHASCLCRASMSCIHRVHEAHAYLHRRRKAHACLHHVCVECSCSAMVGITMLLCSSTQVVCSLLISRLHTSCHLVCSRCLRQQIYSLQVLYHCLLRSSLAFTSLLSRTPRVAYSS